MTLANGVNLAGKYGGASLAAAVSKITGTVPTTPSTAATAAPGRVFASN